MRILVTRPEPGASRTAAELAAQGFEPVLLPLTRIEPLETEEIDALRFDAVAVTSANALRHASETLLSAIRRLPCFVVGQATGQAAKAAGFAHVEAGDGDAVALARTMVAGMRPGTRLLYLCGRLRRPEFERALGKAGLAVVAVETYATLPIDYTAEELQAQIGAEPIAVATVYSAEAAMALLRLIRSLAVPALSVHPRMLCISPRVAAVLSGEGFETVVAPEPSEASMLSALRDISPARP